MAIGANVADFDALRAARAAFIEFVEDAALSLTEAHADVTKTRAWLQYDRVGHWQHAVKKRHEKVQQAKSELVRAQLQSRDERPSCVLERKALVKAQEALAEAEGKLVACRRSMVLLDREGLLFKAALSGFSTTVEVDLPRVVAHIDRLMETLEKYVSIAAPRGGASAGAGPAPRSGGTPAAGSDRGEGAP
ncbi:MAG TPA: hypothetical protein PKC43_02440 [Phycisphaerales bacterium]|nr:hypothetical protein [Phycisphaerales bacterium]HMP36284.1 hypothetical protein [Phycisphaerales bacterium]